MIPQNLVEVYRTQNGPQAHLLAMALSDEGIHAVVEGGPLQDGVGELPFGWSTAPRLLVAEADAQRARAILLRLERVVSDD